MRVQALGDGGAGAAPFNADAIFARAASQAGLGAWACDLAHSTISWTAGVFDLFGLSPAQRFDRRDVVALYDEESRDRMERLRALAIAEGRSFAMEARIVRPNGRRRWMRLSAEAVRENGRTTRLFGLKQDITEEKQRWEALRRIAENDALTGLASRAIYQNVFLNAPRAQPGIVPLGALVLFDLDGFKQINDRFGHAAGDTCLTTFAERLGSVFGDAPMVARIGGDEFAVLVDARLSPRALERRVGDLLADLSRPIVWNGHILVFGASAGIAFAEDPLNYDAERLFAMADKALYAAKAAGRGRVRTSSEWDNVTRLAAG